MRILPSLFVLLLITSCVSAPPPAPPVRRVAPPPVTALPAPAPLASDWRDWPQTPGDWRYHSDAGRSSATFGDGGVGTLTLACTQDHRIRLVSPNGAAGPMTVRTSNLTRTAVTVPLGGSTGGAELLLPASDPLLDAIAFSRGRFVVEQPGAPPLVLPAWAEVGRVIEDCRVRQES